MKIKLLIGLFCLGTSMITLGMCGVYWKYKSFEEKSKMFQKGYVECLKDKH